MKLSRKEAELYVGGATSYIKSTLVSAVTNLIKFVYSVGENLGSSIKRAKNGTSC